METSSHDERDEEEEEEEEEDNDNDIMLQLSDHGVIDIDQTTIAVLGADGAIKDMDLIRHDDKLDMRSPSGEVPTSVDDMILARPFNHSSFSSGLVVLRPDGEKPLSVVRKSTLVFFVVDGHLIVQIHKTSFYTKKGTIFIVPIGEFMSLICSYLLSISCDAT
jgi:mannose-6-phosphate isomerase-like protein (cupin superfamily)